MPGIALLQRQVDKCRLADGSVDYAKLMKLVAAAYDDKEMDRRRADRASQLMSEELEAAMVSLETQNLRFKAALDNMSQGLSLFDAHGKLVVANRRYAEIFELPVAECCYGETIDKIFGRSASLARAPDMEYRLLTIELEFADRKRGAKFEQVWPDGRTICVVRTPVADGGFLDTVSDVTEARQASEKLAYLARHDALTDLPNRVMLRERLAQAVKEAGEANTSAVLCLDLDRFKLVNDTLGHPIGDALLVAVGQRLRGLVRDTDLVARLGGDEFAIIQRLLPTAAMPEALARRIVGALGEPFMLDGQRVQVGVSVGIECIRSSTKDPDEALRNADLALYQAKADGGGYRVFDPEMHTLAAHRRELELDLRLAMEQRQIEVHYQPQMDVKGGQIKGFEALARWRHPKRGLVSPAEFIPLAEEVGLIDRLGMVVLRQACAEAASWPQGVTVAVNLSALQFRSGRLTRLVEQVLEETGLAPARLELEVTEGVMLAETSNALQQLRHLKSLGVHISLDDFGTGYSSLSYIRNFPFDKIKIDQSFVRELETSQDSLAIIRAVTGMCSSLGIKTTAEGVETDGQMAILTREKCDNVQGFLFGKPVAASEVQGFFKSTSPAAAA